MTVLTREAIWRELNSGRLRIEPLDRDQVGPASIDLTLGEAIRRFAPGTLPIPVLEETDFRDHTVRTSLARPTVLEPGATLHGVTVERIALPTDLCGFLEGRSRFAGSA